MPLILIHGDHQVKSRQELQRQLTLTSQQGISDIVTLNGKDCSLTDLTQNLESTSLFGNSSRLVIVENLFRRRSKTELKQILDYLSLIDSGHLILWEDKLLTATQMKPLTSFQKIVFPLPKIIFKLTDAFHPQASPAQILPLLKQTCETDSAELVLIMLARQLRLHIQQKVRGQVFPLSQAIQLHHELAEIDYKNKTGQLALNLTSELQSWIICLYQ